MSAPPKSTAEPTPSSGTDGAIARPALLPVRIALAAVVLVLGGSATWWFGRPKTTTVSVEKAPIEFAAGSDQSQLQQQLEAKIGEYALSIFGSPFKVITDDNITQIEKLIKPYPEATFNAKASSYQESEKDGQVYRLIYDTESEPKTILEWYQKEWAADYLTIHEHESGLAGYSIEIRVPGLHVERDVLIFSVPDKITRELSTQIWVTVRNTGVTNQDSA